jgi:hypothetical protein
MLYTKSQLQACVRKCGRKFTYIIKFGMNPHRDTPSEDGAMTTLE